ncbi:hypothetical protein D8X55_03705 [Malacoplasma penetrans]|nr:hypothetical protein D8X55_03705 [Malacoplasma penetrans]
MSTISLPKNHPYYNEDEDTEWTNKIPNNISGQVQLSNLIINNEDQASQVIYFQKVPWEIFLSWDYKQQMTNKNYVPLFNLEPSLSNTSFIGFQYTTTSIQTTAFFLKDAYNYSLEDINKVLNSFYFPIPETFDVIIRTNKDSFSADDSLNGIYAKNNILKIKNIYDSFVFLHSFPEYEKNQILASSFINQNYDPNYSVNNEYNFSDVDKSFFIIGLIAVITFSFLIFMSLKIFKKESINK